MTDTDHGLCRTRNTILDILYAAEEGGWMSTDTREHGVSWKVGTKELQRLQLQTTGDTRHYSIYWSDFKNRSATFSNFEVGLLCI